MKKLKKFIEHLIGRDFIDLPLTEREIELKKLKYELIRRNN